MAAQPPPAASEPRPIEGDGSAYAAGAITDELNQLSDAAEVAWGRIDDFFERELAGGS